MTNSINIAGRKIGPGYPPLIIAEIGINHNGDLSIAKEMVDAAKVVGVEVVKHQSHIANEEMCSAAKSVLPGNADISIYNIIEQCALTEKEEYDLKCYTEQQGMIFISSPFSRAAADRLKTWNVPAYKIGSGECNNYPLIEHIASFGKPLLISTGMNDLASITPAVEICRQANVPFALLHCTNLYPTPYELVRLEAMVEMQSHFPDAVIGLSDHSLTIYPCLGAVALGASVLERHFTDHKKRIGPDIPVSMDKAECNALIEGANAIWLAKFGSKNELLPEEQVTRDFAFASVVSITDIRKGEVFTLENLWVKRPGTGDIHAKHYKDILGKKAAIDIQADQMLRWIDVN